VCNPGIVNPIFKLILVHGSPPLTFYLPGGRIKTMNTQANTAQQIIEIALGLMIERGYNAFSYADISERM